ncbi:uncharacterized protein YALI1_C17220g [Yarrowia lipolytica]|uniref:Uncharacterized protein n=1 Tax=Yarrowia lipolytica TaxID=4952 RepID=A0A1D8NAU2_YARLL|nr:hypothetical protein YALI1_C17220g [Yarrowia lipolytica]
MWGREGRRETDIRRGGDRLSITAGHVTTHCNLSNRKYRLLSGRKARVPNGGLRRLTATLFERPSRFSCRGPSLRGCVSAPAACHPNIPRFGPFHIHLLCWAQVLGAESQSSV